MHTRKTARAEVPTNIVLAQPLLTFSASSTAGGSTQVRETLLAYYAGRGSKPAKQVSKGDKAEYLHTAGRFR